jgi:transcription elongation factor Elf1
MDKPDMRWKARECVARAKTLLANGDEPSARYACLELRFAIEYLTYDLVQTYREELPYDTLKKWQPRELIAEMRTVDPYADCSSRLDVGPEVIPGEPPPTEGWRTLGEEHRFSIEWANKNYSALGNYLHAPTLHQLESGNAPTGAVIIAKATEVLHECEKVLNSGIWNNYFANFFSFTCGECKAPMRGRVKDPTQKQALTCRQCRAVHDVEIGEGQTVTLALRQSQYVCPAPCGAPNRIGTHRLVEGAIFACGKCGKKARVQMRHYLVDVDASIVS